MLQRTVKADDWFFAFTREGRDFGCEVKSPFRPQWIEAIVLIGRVVPSQGDPQKRYFKDYIPWCLASLLASWRELTEFFARDDYEERLGQLTAETRAIAAARRKISVEALQPHWDDSVHLSPPKDRFAWPIPRATGRESAVPISMLIPIDTDSQE
ncbi:MAG: hypothetical protein ACYDHD_11585 [Vulcanimicrobiaceae bacterium]